MPDLSKLNDAQRRAVTFGEGPLLVLAGPGSGKTFTITQRIFYLLFEKKIPPEEILVITFTKEAAKSMQERFLKLSDSVYPVSFGTFHSVFYHILKISHVISSQSILSGKQKMNLLIPVLKKLYGSMPSDTQNSARDKNENLREDAAQILSVISYFKNTNDETASRSRLPSIWQPFFEKLLSEYEKARRASGAIDFDDMLFECLTLLKTNQAMRKYWQNRFSHILIDEFQDINPVQYEIIKLLLKPPYSLFAVGDDDQAIYGFRGSAPACLKRFAEEYRAEQILLNINYRSFEEIVEASLLVIGENRERFSKKLEASPEHRSAESGSRHACVEQNPRGVSLRVLESREEQYGLLTEELKKEKGQCAVLFRTNFLMQSFAVRLKRAGIPYEMKEKPQNIYEHFIAKDILAYLQFASVYGRENPPAELLQGKTKRELLLRILNKPSRYISREALGEGEPDFQNIMAYYRSSEETTDGDGRSAGSRLEAVRKLEKDIKYLQKASLKAAVSYIRKAAGYEKYLQETAGNDGRRLQEWMEYLEWLTRDCRGFDTLEEWMKAWKTCEEETGDRGRRSSDKAVQLLTVHASKGLEFEHVFLPDCNEKVFPHGTMPDAQACEEERRIFYVAMTRAQKSLRLFCITGTKERPRLPSRFLNPLWKKYYSSTSSSNSQLSRYSSNASATFSYSPSSSMKESSGSSSGSSGFSL